MREALGAIPVGAPAAYLLRRHDDHTWAVRRDGEAIETSYPTRKAAMRAIHLAVVRCVSYRVSLQEGDACYVVESSDGGT